MSDRARYEFFEHTADIGLDAYGSSMSDAIAQVAAGMFAIITDNREVRPVEQYRFAVETDDFESLLIRFLTKLLVLHESENVVLTDFAVKLNSNTSLTATCAGEPFDESRHGGGVHVKAISYHMMEIDPPHVKVPAHVKVLFDI